MKNWLNLGKFGREYVEPIIHMLMYLYDALATIFISATWVQEEVLLDPGSSEKFISDLALIWLTVNLCLLKVNVGRLQHVQIS